MDKKMKVRIGIGAAIAVAAVLLMLSGKKKGQQGPMGMGQEAAATIVKAQKPSVGDISLTTGLTGTVEPSDVVYVYAKASGDVTSVLVKAGDMVEQGQVLCEIDTEQVETARNSMMQILYASGDLSDQEYEQYSNKVKSARLQYESAKLAYDRQVEYSTVTAPISGKIENCDIEVHDRVSQSAQLCVIAGEGEKRVSFYVTERMMGNIAVGDRLDIQKDGTGYEAYISEISSMVDSDTGLFKVKAELKHADGIATGSTVKLNLVTEHTENAMMIPVDAVYYSGGDGYVYLYQDGVAAMVPVEVGLYDAEHAEILSGLSADDLVVSTWSSNLYEGARIQLRTEDGQGAGADAQGQPGADTPGQPGADAQGQPGTDTPGQPGADAQGQPGADVQGQPGADTQVQSGADAQTAADNGAE